MATIRSEARLDAAGNPEVWANLGDILDWLETLPSQTQHGVAGAVALEIKTMLMAAVGNATIVRRHES